MKKHVLGPIWVWGFYDSRGGTVAVLAPDRQTAFKRIAEVMCWEDFEIDWYAEDNDIYLGTGNLVSDFDIIEHLKSKERDPKEGADLEDEMDLCVLLPDSDEFWKGGDLQVIKQGEEIPEGWKQGEWNDDAFSFILYVEGVEV